MAAKRIYWAIESLAIQSEVRYAPKTGGDITAADFVSGVQSVGITTTFNLEQVFQLGQLSLYQDIEEVPDVEVTVERVLDQNDLMWSRCMGSGSITSGQNVECNVYFSVYADTVELVGKVLTPATTPDTSVWCSGMFLSSASYTFPTDGNFTESVTLVGNHAEWGTGTLATALPNGAPTADASGEVKRRNTITEAQMNTIISNLSGDIGAAAKVTNMSVSVDLGREAINILGRKLPYHRYVTYPVEVSCEVETVAIGGTNVDAYPEQSNVSARTISIPAGPHTFNLGAKNKLQSVTWGGGTTGGENATITYSYRNFNELTIT